ncbi:pseudoazurin [Rhodophyticola sp. CCM32]|uniref:pseudoazurin n=1 Tax=Rhodophyticola sp. CCM32 TaxID=2916397 RepID=UPI00107F5A5E|nr:pseudoazurin [Rhodophyticola sp. CCM32]QBY01633.1 pseudoazurin [Rhodophyticola sp. CCM32]
MRTDPDRRTFIVTIGAFAGLSGVGLANTVPVTEAGHHAVMMLNAACGDTQTPNVFQPPILRVALGDVVTFVPTDTGHNTASRRGMIPEGAEPWNGGVNEEVTMEMTVPGIYGYVCTPHYEVGMVGLIVVDDDLSNLDAVRSVRQRGQARTAFRALFEEL